MGLCGCHAGHTRLGLYGCQSRTVGGLTSPRCRTHTAPVDLAQTASSRWRVPSGHAGHTRLGGRFSMHIIKGFRPGETGGIREKKKNLSWSFLETLEATPVSNMILCLHTFGLLSLRVFFEGGFFSQTYHFHQPTFNVGLGQQTHLKHGICGAHCLSFCRFVCPSVCLCTFAQVWRSQSPHASVLLHQTEPFSVLAETHHLHLRLWALRLP